MKTTKNYNSLFSWLVILFTSNLFTSCGVSNQSIQRDYEQSFESLKEEIKNKFTSLKNAYVKYDQGQFGLAIKSFTEICDEDSDANYYDAYAFLAESYKKLNLIDSGFDAYDKGIAKLNKRVVKYPAYVSNVWMRDSLVEWRKNYPAFPIYLTKEDGYVPFDILGDPINNPSPKYPISARRKGKEGTCWTRAVIDESGGIVDASIIQSVDEDLDEAALGALSKWKFKPFLIRGRVAKVEVTVPFKFRLN